MSIDEIARATYSLSPPFTEFRLAGVGLNNRALGIRSAEGDFIWKIYQTHADPATIRYEHRLLAWLDRRDLSFAVPSPVRTQSGDSLVPTPQGWGALFKLLPGEQPDRRCIDHVRAFGAALGELHCALVTCPRRARPGLHGYAALRHVHPAVPDPFALTPTDLGLPATAGLRDLLARWRHEAAELDEFTRRSYARLPWQMTHGDYAPGNILILNNRVSAVLDFDMAQPDARAIDIAAGLKFSLNLQHRVENSSGEGHMNRDQPDPLAFGAAFWQGYTEWVRPTDAEIAAMPHLIRLRDAVSTIWWLGRGLMDGDVSAGIRRMNDLMMTKEWLTENDEGLSELV